MIFDGWQEADKDKDSFQCRHQLFCFTSLNSMNFTFCFFILANFGMFLHSSSLPGTPPIHIKDQHNSTTLQNLLGTS